MLEFSAKPQTAASVLPETPASSTPQEEKHGCIRQTVPPQSVREFIERREDAATRAERMGLPKMIEDLREQLCQVEATIRIFRRMEAAKHRGPARPAHKAPTWTTTGRTNHPSSSV
jgi:hypothetical protein